jgi:branched-chain amino acid transport system ATP-binding protein
MNISNTVIGMHNGEILAWGTPLEVRQNEEMIEAYLGGEI